MMPPLRYAIFINTPLPLRQMSASPLAYMILPCYYWYYYFAAAILIFRHMLSFIDAFHITIDIIAIIDYFA